MIRLTGLLALFGVLAEAAPFFLRERVLPANSAIARPIAPGMLVSIYNRGLGPVEGCTGYADSRETEKPSPRRLWQADHVHRLLLKYPQELCGVRVLVNGSPAGLLYAQDQQINFKVPLDVPARAQVGIIVESDGVRSAEVELETEGDEVGLAPVGTWKVGGPAWIEVRLPFGWYPGVRYPVATLPQEFWPHVFEARRNGVLLSRRRTGRTGGVVGGLFGGMLSIPGEPPDRLPRMPLHLWFEFNEAGEYEVRYCQLDRKREIWIESEWVRVQVSAGAPTTWSRVPPPQDVFTILTEYLPGLLSRPDAQARRITQGYLQHSSLLVREYARHALAFFTPSSGRDSSHSKSAGASTP